MNSNRLLDDFNHWRSRLADLAGQEKAESSPLLEISTGLNHLAETMVQRQQIEDQLKEARDYAQNIIETSLGMIVVVDRNRRIIGFNRAALDTFGYTEEEILGRHIDVLYADSREGLVVAETVLAEGRFVGEITNITKNGQTFPCILSANVMRDARGRVMGIVGNSMDITERKQSELALKEARDYAQNIIESSLGMIVVVDQNRRIIGFNKAALDTFDYKEEDILGRHINVLYADEREGLTVAETVLAEGRFVGEITNITKNGQTFPTILSASVMRDDRGQVVGIVGNSMNITDRKRIENALEEARDYAQNIIDSSLDMIVAVNWERRVTEFNPAAERTFGYEAREIIGQPVNILYADWKQGDRVADEVFEKGLFVGEITNIRKNAETFPSVIHASIMISQDGQIVGKVGVSRDITEQKKAEAALKAQEEALKLQKKNLEEVNTALSVLLDRREEEKKQQEADMLATLDKLVFPYLEKMGQTQLTREQRMLLNIVQSNLTNVASPFASRLSSLEAKLTPTELEVADLLRHARTSKEIAELLNLSETTVNFHRRNIRKKLGLKNKRVNLKTFLRSHA